MSSKKPKLVFIGTPEFAVVSLNAIVDSAQFEVAAIVTQPDKPSGRGMKLTPPPVKAAAEQLGLPVFQPSSVKKVSSESGVLLGTPKNEDLIQFLNENGPFDAFVVVAYGMIIPNALIEYPRCGMVNVHPSLLPRWRGAAPIQWALFSGDEKTGIAVMKLVEELDAGPVYSSVEDEIKSEDDFGALNARLARLGAKLLVDTLPQILDGSLEAKAQSESGLTYAEKWDNADCQIDWTERASITARRIRTCAPNLGARTTLAKKPIKIFKATEVNDQNFTPAAPGQIVEVNKRELIVAAGENSFLSLKELLFPGKKRLAISDILRGHSFTVEERFV